MNDIGLKEGVWFIYDGECPICTHAAHALRIKEEYGVIHLVNARENSSNPLVMEINKRGLDLDDGMVIISGEEYFHGKEALKFMARYGEQKNVFMVFCKNLFWSDNLSGLMYPWMRATRNWLLYRKGATRIDNLELKSKPIFSSVFGKEWDSLPTVFKKHYANRPYTEDETVVSGALDVMSKAPLTWVSPIMELLGQIPIRNENDVPVTVRFQSDRNTKAFSFNRTFNFKDARPYTFYSRMLQISNDEVIELMRFGFGWKMRYSWNGEKVILSHRGYAIQLFGYFIPLPLTILMGKGYAEESAVDDTTFDMMTHITHPLWGKIYEYKGRFEVIS
ncbi:MAG: DUF4166 domain-containing protein [Gammaproteobacteria bacterium]|jgi:predicted DCC family thiol-disulfide oxidoreductase YuxK